MKKSNSYISTLRPGSSDRPEEPHSAGVTLKTKLSLLGTIGLLLILSYFTYSKILYSPQHLFASYFSPHRPPVVMQNAPEHINEEWRQAIQYYTGKNYQKASDQFYSLIDNGAYPNYIVHFYAGVSYLGSGSYENAEYAREEFNIVLNSENDFKPAARWYLALSYVRLDRDQKATQLLRKISESLDFKHDEASDLLERL